MTSSRPHVTDSKTMHVCSSSTTFFRYENGTAIPPTMDWRKKGAAANHTAKITRHEYVPTNSESALLKAVANQPISVANDAGGSVFQFYSSDVFMRECGTELDHGVTAIGYGTSEDGTKYWSVKNSWGTS
ncbi:hypothetical protein LguiA_035097 [Lonicera macranthoides]